MKLKFKHQKFQSDAAKAVVDVFAGQPLYTATSYMIDRGITPKNDTSQLNLLDKENYMHQKDICKEAIELLGDDISMIHIKDYIVRDGDLVSLACGLGQMDYSDIVKFAKERKPFIHATLEDTKPDNSLNARLHLQKLYDEA